MHVAFCVDSEDLNSDLHSCEANALWTEPCPLPRNYFYMKYRGMTLCADRGRPGLEDPDRNPFSLLVKNSIFFWAYCSHWSHGCKASFLPSIYLYILAACFCNVVSCCLCRAIEPCSLKLCSTLEVSFIVRNWFYSVSNLPSWQIRHCTIFYNLESQI